MPDGEPPSVPSPAPAAGSAHRLDVEVRADRAEEVAAALWARGATGVWEQPGALVAWFAPDASAASMTRLGEVDGVPELAASAQRWSLEPDRDWQAEWKRTIRPVRAGRVVIVPSWLAGGHTPGPDELTLVLDPGRAFGSGHHATTTLCLELLDALDAGGELRGRTVADIGCGTGVLAIAAAAWGAVVTAVDIDPDAVAVTRENAARNRVSLTTAVGSADTIGTVHRAGGARGENGAGGAGGADIVVANLVTDVVVDLADALVAATGTTLIVSGIARERRDRALDALQANGARTAEVRERDGWIAARLLVGAGAGAGA